MKRIWIVVLTLALAVTMVSPAFSAGGDATDPVVTLSYLNDVLKPELMKQYRQLAAKNLTQTYAAQFSRLVDSVGAYRLRQQRASVVAQRAQGAVMLKKGDVLTPAPGCKVALKSGKLLIDNTGTVDVTTGIRAAKGTDLKPRLLYMMSDAVGGLQVTSDTAELHVDGVYTLAASTATDYGSMALALSEMGLLQGTGTGYALDSTATRAQGLVMFLRILGLEQEALAYTGTSPFTDVPKSDWAYKYVAYASSNGLTAGTSATKFSPNAAITAQHYVTFLLRALHYGEGNQFTYDTALTDVSKLGLFSQKEMSTLSAGQFLRSKMVYLSFYGLFGVDQQSDVMLLTRLVRTGAVREVSFTDGICKLYGTRIS